MDTTRHYLNTASGLRNSFLIIYLEHIQLHVMYIYFINIFQILRGIYITLLRMQLHFKTNMFFFFSQ